MPIGLPESMADHDADELRIEALREALRLYAEESRALDRASNDQ